MRRALGLPPKQPSPALEPQQPSSGEEQWAGARADILAAALHLVANDPNILKTEGLLAEGAHAHKAAMCGKKVGRHIGASGALALVKEAINTGKVHKN